MARRLTEERISYDETMSILLQIISGELEIRCKPGYCWADAEAICCFVAGDYEISFFRDAGVLDYLDWIEHVDGRFSDCDFYIDGRVVCPIEDGLTDEQEKQLDRKLHESGS